KDSFEEKIKHSSDYAVRLIDDLSGYVEEKLSHIDSKKISEIDERLNIFSERYNELSKNLSELANVQKKIDEIRDESMKSISEIENKLNEKFLKIEEVNLEKFKELENLARNKVDYGLITQNIDAINDKIKMLSEDFQDKINKIFSDFIAKTRELEIFTNEIKFELHHLRERNQDVDLKISFLEKNQNEIATILKTQINQSFSELKDEFSQRIKDLYGMLDELKQKYDDSLEFETTIVTLVNSLDKRLTELSE
ncbi:MAG: hypothetical protein N3E38_03360, partial [Candidatus Aenigmarchaeota archaeon]|nr:hypothetical protein [Candidatus Aenigmarchaeota archaeon]